MQNLSRYTSQVHAAIQLHASIYANAQSVLIDERQGKGAKHMALLYC